jgi:ADP-ribose pyrophosphatase YjhB (NUDIX family)
MRNLKNNRSIKKDKWVYPPKLREAERRRAATTPVRAAAERNIKNAVENNTIKSIRVVLWDKDGNLILQHRDNKPGVAQPDKITFFGGGIEDGERPIEAAIREMKEELTLSLKQEDLRLIDFHESGFETISVYEAKNVDRKKLSIQEGQGIVVFSLQSNLGDYNLSLRARKFIEFLKTRK